MQEEHEIFVHADVRRQLHVADPRGREMLISCGAALFNIRVALRHLGYLPGGQRSLPETVTGRTLVARVRWGDRIPAAEYEEQLFGEIERRRTHRDAFLPTALPRWPAGRPGAPGGSQGGGDAAASPPGTTSAPALAATVSAAEHTARPGQRPQRRSWRGWARPPGSPHGDGVPVTGVPGQAGT